MYSFEIYNMLLFEENTYLSVKVQISQKKETDREQENFNMFYIKILLVKIQSNSPIFL